MRLTIAIAVLAAGCGGPGGATDSGMDASIDGAAPDAGASDARTSDAGPGDAGPTGPDPSCVVPDIPGDIVIDPDPATRAPFTVLVTSATPHTNVGVRLCTPSGAVDATFHNVSGSYTWEWGAPAVAAGQTQIQFYADPSARVVATRRILVGASDDAGTPMDAGVGDPCTPPAFSLIEGTFETGFDGLAPRGWQVRDPAAPGRCGDAASHVFLTAPPPGCAGNALAVDARGTWDCYAIQVYTDYDTIRGGRTYRVSAMARSVGRDNPGGWFFLGLSWLDGADRVFGDERNPRIEPLDFDWRRVEFDVVAPSEARRAVVWLTAHYEGRMDFDQVSIVER